MPVPARAVLSKDFGRRPDDFEDGPTPTIPLVLPEGDLRPMPSPMYSSIMAPRVSPPRQRPAWRPVTSSLYVDPEPPPAPPIVLSAAAGVEDAREDYGRAMVDSQMEVLNIRQRQVEEKERMLETLMVDARRVQEEMERAMQLREADAAGAVQAMGDRLAEMEAMLRAKDIEGLRREIDMKQARIEELEALLSQARAAAQPVAISTDSRQVDELTVKYEETVADLREKLADAQKQLADLRQRHKEMLSSALGDINAANEKLSQQEAKMDEAKAALAAERKRADEALARVAELEGLLDEAGAGHARLAREVKRLEDAKADLERERDGLRAKLSAAAAVEGELAALREELARQKRRGDGLQEDLERATRDNEEKAKLRRDLDKLQQELNGAMREITRLKSELADKDEELRRAKAEAAGLQRALADLTNEVAALKEKGREEMTRERARWEQALEEKGRQHDEELRRLRAEIQRLQRVIEQLEEEKRGLARKAEEWEDASGKLRKAMERIRALEGELEEEANLKRAAERDLRQSQKEMLALQQQLSEAKGEAKRLQEELERMKQRHQEDLAKADAQHREEVSRMTEKHRSELERLQEKHASEIGRLEAKHADALRRAQDELARVNEEAARQKQRYGDEIAALRDEMKALVERHRDEVGQLKEEMKRLTERHTNEVAALQENMKQAAERHREEVSRLQNEIERLKRELSTAGQEVAQPLPAPPQPLPPPPPVVVMQQEGEEEIMRMGAELRKALRLREEALAEVETLQKLLAKSRRQHEVAQQELETSEARLAAARRQCEDLKTELEATIGQLGRARLAAQEALDEAEASAQMLQDARRVAEETKNCMALELMKQRQEMEAAQAAWAETSAIHEADRVRLAEQVIVEQEKRRSLEEATAAKTHYIEELTQQLAHVHDSNALHRTHLEDTATSQFAQLQETHQAQVAHLVEKHANEVAHLRDLEQAALRECAQQKDIYEAEVQRFNVSLEKAHRQKEEIQKALEEQLSKAFQNVLDATNDIKKLREDLQGAHQQKDGLEQELLATQHAMDKLTRHTEALQQQNEDLRVALRQGEEAAERRCMILDRELTRTKEEVEAQMAHSQLQGEAITEGARCRQELEKEVHSLRMALDSRTEVREGELAHCKSLLEEKEAELLRSHREMERASAEVAQLAAQLKDVVKREGDTAAELAAVQAMCESRAAEAEQLRVELDLAKKRLASSVLQLEENKSVAEQNEAVLTNARKQIEASYMTKVKELNDQLTEAWAQHTACKKELCRAQEDAERKGVSLQLLEKRLEEEGRARDEMQREQHLALQEAKSETQRVVIELDQLTLKLKTSEANEDRALTKTAELQRTLETRIAAAAEELAAERAVREEADKQLAQSRQQARQAKREQCAVATELEAAKEAIAALEDEKQQLVRKSRTEVDLVRRQHAAAQENVESLEGQLRDLQQEARFGVMAREKQVAELRGELEELHSLLAEREAQLAEAKALHMEAQRRVARLDDELVAKADLLQQVRESSEAALLKAREAHESAVGRMLGEKKEGALEYDQLRSAFAEQSAALCLSQQKLEAAEAAMEVKERELSTLRCREKALEVEVGELAEQRAELLERVQAAQRAAEDLRQRTADLQTDLSSRTAELAVATGTAEGLRREIEALERELSASRQGGQVAAADLVRLQELLTEKDASYTRMNGEIKDLSAVVESLRRSLAEKDDRLDNARLTTEALEAEVDRMRGEEESASKVWNSELSACREALAAEKARCSELHETVLSLQRSVEEGSAARQALQLDVSSKQLALDRLQGELRDVKQEAQSNRDHITQLESQRRRLEEELATQTAAMKSAKHEVSAKTSELEQRSSLFNIEVESFNKSVHVLTKEIEFIMGFVDSFDQPHPSDAIRRCLWRVQHKECESEKITRSVGAACERSLQLFRLQEACKSLHATFDFICTTREAFVREVVSCRNAIGDIYATASSIMEAVLVSPVNERTAREACGRMCAALGGVKSQLGWIVVHCVSEAERKLLGVADHPASESPVGMIRKSLAAHVGGDRSTPRALRRSPERPRQSPSVKPAPALLSSPAPSPSSHYSLAMQHYSPARPASPKESLPPSHPTIFSPDVSARSQEAVTPTPATRSMSVRSKFSESDLHSCWGSDDGDDTRPSRRGPSKTPSRRARVISPTCCDVVPPPTDTLHSPV